MFRNKIIVRTHVYREGFSFSGIAIKDLKHGGNVTAADNMIFNT
jgi:hypothetical protein